MAAEQTGGAKQAPATTASDVWWDVGGWVMLGAFLVGALVLARKGAPAPSA